MPGEEKHNNFELMRFLKEKDVVYGKAVSRFIYCIWEELKTSSCKISERRLGMMLTWKSACLACRKAWGWSPEAHKPGVIAHICNISTWKVDVGGSQIQDHPPPLVYLRQFGLHEILSQTNKQKNRAKEIINWVTNIKIQLLSAISKRRKMPLKYISVPTEKKA